MHFLQSGSADGTPPSPELLREMQRRMGPPDNEVPGAIPFHAVLGRTDDFALALVGADAYSTGIVLSFAARLRYSDQEDNDLHEQLYSHRRGPSAGQLLIGVAYPDGQAATNVAARPYREMLRELDKPQQPMLVQRGGGGGGREFGFSMWLAPLPPPGDLTIVIEWPARGIPETHTTIPADVTAAGVAATVELWPWEPATDGDERPVPDPPDLPEGGWFAKHTPDASDVADRDE